MRVLLVYYTGTYNTRFLSHQVEKRFLKQGAEVVKVEINKDCEVVSTDGFDYVGLGYPIYGFNSPQPFNRYFRKLKFHKGQKYFIYKNSGETFGMNNASSRAILRKMKRKKCIFSGEYHFVMPYNIHFEFDEDFIYQILIENKKLLDIMFYNLENNVSPTIKSNLLYNAGAFFVGVQKYGGQVNSFFYKVDYDKCNNCGLCIKNCPSKNIRIKDGKVKFGHRCDMCMRCSFYCPQKAIHIGLLEGWRVNKYYNIEEMANKIEGMTPPEYITKESSGFYKCYISYFDKINTEHERIFRNKDKNLKSDKSDDVKINI